MRILAVAFLLATALTPAAHGQTPAIHRATFVSPDKRFALKVSDDFTESGFTLEDLKSGKVVSSDDNDDVDVPGPIFFVGWTGDSKTVLVISHSDSGSIATAVHFDGTRWRAKDLQPPLKLAKDTFYFLLQHHLGLRTINLSYGIDAPTAGGRDSYTRSSFEFDPTTGRYGGVNNVPADHGIYREREFN